MDRILAGHVANVLPSHTIGNFNAKLAVSTGGKVDLTNAGTAGDGGSCRAQR